MENLTPEAFVLGLSAIATMGTAMAALAIGIGQGLIGAKAVEGVARQPEAAGDILKTMVVGQALTETTGIFAFIISAALLFMNPLVAML